MEYSTNVQFDSECNECRNLERQNNELREEYTEAIDNANLALQVMEDNEKELQAENERLRQSLAKIFKYMDDEVLVRNISKDHESGWAMNILRLAMDLKEAHALLNPPLKESN